MATSIDYIQYVCDQIRGFPNLRYRKMFGEYMVYINEKPVLLVCDNTVYLKKQPEKYPPDILEKLDRCQSGCPYDGAKEHYILDVDDPEFLQAVVIAAEQITPLPKPKKKRAL